MNRKVTNSKTGPAVDDRTLPLDLGAGESLDSPIQTDHNAKRKQERQETRLANLRIRHESTIEKRQDRSKALALRSGTDAGIAAMNRAQRKHKDNPKAQIAMFFREFVVKSGTGRARPVSQRTSSAYVSNLMLVLDELRDNRASVRNISEFGKSHVLKLIQYWGLQGHSAGTIHWKLSILRRFLTFIGKDAVLPKGQEFRSWLNSNGVEPPDRRQLVARESKAWDENGVTLQIVLGKVQEICSMTAIQLEMQAAFGLRMKESLQLNPKASDYGNVLRVLHGTKGGMPRDVNFDNDAVISEWQRDVLERAKLLAETNYKGILAIKGKRLDQNIQHFYYVVRKVGISREGLGVTAHGLRHQYAARRYREISGQHPPVSGLAPSQITSEVKRGDLEAREQVSRELGHFRPSVVQAYTGSLPMLDRTRRQNIRDWVERTEDNPLFQQAMKEAGIQSVWLGGRFAEGLPVAQNEKLRVIVALQGFLPMSGESRLALKQRLNEIYGRGVDLSEQSETGSPEDALEIIIRSVQLGSSNTARTG